jgi:hypothetical protein
LIRPTDDGDVTTLQTHVANETSHEGFHAEWRVISVLTFDEADLNAALARFEELDSAGGRDLENR